MKALIILYEGAEISDHLIEQVMMASNLKSASVAKFTDEEVVKILVSNCHSTEVECVNPEQEAVDHAAAYIAQTVLKHHTDNIQIAIAISNRILSGDTNMRTAVEILATHEGMISEKGFTKAVMSVIKKIYQATQNNVL